MQTNLLSTQSTSGANNANAPARNAANGSSNNGSQFGAMLSNQMVERKAALPLPPTSAPAPAPKTEAPKPQAADKPVQHDDAPPPSSSTQAAKADAADASQSADADTDADKADDDAAAKADPAAEMLALMASLQQPGQDAAGAAKGKPSAASQAFDALGGGKAKRGDAQLAALQAAMKSVSKETGLDGAGASGKTFSAATLKNPALAAAGADLGLDAADTGANAASGAADLRTALGAVKGEVKPQLDAADLVLQQARDAALQAATQSAGAADASPLSAALAQPAMLEAAEAAAAASESLSARVGTDQWENQVGQKIVYMVGSEEQTASLTLNPPDLGPLQVVLSVSNDQASVTFSANQEEVRQALENALPRLREMMSESGIALGNASVNAGMPDGRQAQDQAAQSSRGFGRAAGRADKGAGDVDDAAARPLTRTVTLGDRGMVDTFA
jgi:flagellar hook-length control protein FliK